MMFLSRSALQVSPQVSQNSPGPQKLFSFFKHIYIFLLALDTELRGYLLLIVTLLLVAA